MGRFGQFIKRRGILLAAGLCVAAAGVAGIHAINGMIAQLGSHSLPAPEDTPPGSSSIRESERTWPSKEIEEAPVGKAESNVPKSSSAASSRAPSSSSVSVLQPDADAPAALPPVSSPRFVRPVAGEVLAAFSGDELMYNETMDDWRTHNGTDFAAAYGEKVCSVTAGIVTGVREDPLWGWTVTVESPEGLLRYSGLARKPAVKEGEAVSAGDTLGKLDELDAEIALEPHLHVEYEKDGRLCDVMELLAG